MTLSQFLLVLLIAAVNAAAQVVLKKANVSTLNWAMATNTLVWLGAFMYASAFWLWVKVINELEMSVAVPLMGGLMYTLAMFAAWYFFKEQITPVKIAGVFLICVGIFMITKKF